MTSYESVEIGTWFLQKSILQLSQLEARRESRRILCFVLHITEHSYFVEPKRTISLSEFRIYSSLLRRRAKGEPFAYLTGSKEFYSIQFTVNQSVLIPRPETEELIDIIIADYSNVHVQRVLDIGTGSGNIAAALANQWPKAYIVAVDLSVDALETARQNFIDLNLEKRIELIHSDLLDSLEADEKSFDLIVSNPPYILKKEFDSLQIDVRDYEPYTALIVEQPESFYKRLFQQVLKYLKPKSNFYLESSPTIINSVSEMAMHAGFSDCQIRKDLSGHDRFLIATYM